MHPEPSTQVDRNEQETSWLIQPTNAYKINWDMLVTIVLLYSCIATPVQIALYEELGPTPATINAVVDCLFLLDIIIIFNSGYIDEKFNII